MFCRNLWGAFGGICGLSGKCIQVHRQERSEPRAASAGVKLQGRGTPIPCAADRAGSAGPTLPAVRELMPSESGYPGAQRGGGRILQHPPSTLPGALRITTRAARVQTRCIPAGHEKVKASLPRDKDQVKGVSWEWQAPLKAPGASGCWGAEQDLWRAKHPCISWLDQQLPTGPSSWRICLGMFG